MRDLSGSGCWAFALLAFNVPQVCDVWRSGVAGLARHLRFSASDVTKPNVAEGPEGAQRLEQKPAVMRSARRGGVGAGKDGPRRHALSSSGVQAI